MMIEFNLLPWHEKKPTVLHKFYVTCFAILLGIFLLQMGKYFYLRKQYKSLTEQINLLKQQTNPTVQFEPKNTTFALAQLKYKWASSEAILNYLTSTQAICFTQLSLEANRYQLRGYVSDANSLMPFLSQEKLQQYFKTMQLLSLTSNPHSLQFVIQAVAWENAYGSN